MFDASIIFWVANSINAIGAILSFWATYAIGASHSRSRVFLLMGCYGALLTVGSAMLGSYPTAVLNVLWLGVAALGYVNWEYPKATKNFRFLLPIITILGFFALALGKYTLAAYACTAIYIFGIILFSAHHISRVSYLAWCLLAFLLLFPHLVEYKSYAVLIQESISAFLTLCAIHKLKNCRC